jgi:hypothetical protein
MQKKQGVLVEKLAAGESSPGQCLPIVRVCLLTTQDLDADPFPSCDWPCDLPPNLHANSRNCSSQVNS